MGDINSRSVTLWYSFGHALAEKIAENESG